MMTNSLEFNYEAFDRQMETLITMSYVLIGGWEDYATQELTFDIRSLCVKASRLCGMADTDAALQQDDLTHTRRGKNRQFFARMTGLVVEDLSPLMAKTVKEIRERQTLERPSGTLYQQDMSTLLPRLGEWLTVDGMSKERFEEISDCYMLVEKRFVKKVKPSHYPGASWQERFLNLIRYYAYMCYLLYHFQRMMEVSGMNIEPEEAGRMLTKSVQIYLDTERGDEELRRYCATLFFQNDGETLSDSQLKAARRHLVTEVPACLQTCFMENFSDINALAVGILQVSPPPTGEEFETMLGVIAKCQWLTEQLYAWEHPDDAPSSIYNKVFRASVNGKPVDMKALRKVIGEMLRHVEKKNHWFCVYSVLKFRNLIKDPTATHFAEQMMHPDWFPDLPERLWFKGETLSEYNGYLNDTRFPAWNEADFGSYRARYGKKKWSSELWRKFQRRCEMMNEAFNA